MSNQAIGRLFDSDGSTPLSSISLENLRATLTDVSQIHDSILQTITPADDGSLNFNSYAADSLAGIYGSRRVRLEIRTVVGRLVYQTEQTDSPDPVLQLGNIPIPAREVTPSWAVTLGMTLDQMPNGRFPFFSQNNTVRFLVDNEDAWGYVATKLAVSSPNAIKFVEILQLEFDIPKDFNTTVNLESPEIVFKFGDPIPTADLVATKPRPIVYPNDYRPEAGLRDLSSSNTQVRLMLSDPAVLPDLNVGGALLALLILLVLLPLVIIAAPFLVPKIIKGLWGNLHDLQSYFKAANANGANVAVKGFPVTTFNRVHAKVVIVDRQEAIVTASPLIQGYYDTPAHLIDEPKRGSGVKVPIHDVSMSVRGPAVADMYATYALHWNLVTPNGIPDTVTVGPATPNSPSEIPSALQLVRTINAGAFIAPLAVPNLANGEKGVLEAYLRAIANAQQFMYFENQYFTNETIGRAVVAAIKARPSLQAIFMINVTPDIPFYPGWQDGLIMEMVKELTSVGLQDQLGFFTAWSHETFSQAPFVGRIIPNYLHTKVGIIDNQWATVGSANLDGASLDFFQVVHALQAHDNRNHEMNFLIFDGIENQPTTGAVDALRTRLWGEHLGPGVDVSASAMQGQWLPAWRTGANLKLGGLQNTPGSPLGTRVLPYPTGPGRVVKESDGEGGEKEWTEPGDPLWYLKALGIDDFGSLQLVDHVRSFSFKKGTWD